MSGALQARHPLDARRLRITVFGPRVCGARAAGATDISLSPPNGGPHAGPSSIVKRSSAAATPAANNHTAVEVTPDAYATDSRLHPRYALFVPDGDDRMKLDLSTLRQTIDLNLLRGVAQHFRENRLGESGIVGDTLFFIVQFRFGHCVNNLLRPGLASARCISNAVAMRNRRV
jgi:hypothetical protein